MSNINFGRVLLGGLVAGLILNIGEFVLNEKVLAAEMKDFFAKHNFHEPGTNFIATAIALTFLLGIVIVLGYAAIRPRFGAGPKTAIIAALFAWFGVYFYSGVIQGMLFGTTIGTTVIILAWGLVEYIAGALVGAWLYKEA